MVPRLTLTVPCAVGVTSLVAGRGPDVQPGLLCYEKPRFGHIRVPHPGDGPCSHIEPVGLMLRIIADRKSRSIKWGKQMN